MNYRQIYFANDKVSSTSLFFKEDVINKKRYYINSFSNHNNNIINISGNSIKFCTSVKMG